MQMHNRLHQLRELLAPGRVQIGTVLGNESGMTIVEFPGGGKVRAKGDATSGKVFVQDGVIQGPAPNLPAFVDVI